MLIDCDNFFVSCERIFQPVLNDRPVVVLSNNDGCVVSRSNEAKKIGIPMCTPYFKVEKILKAYNGVALSSNYELYADISQRVMSLLRQQFGPIEIYSIDEAFAEVPFHHNFFTLASNLRQDILQQAGVPVSIGIAKTKTLCKVAGHFAKKQFKLCQLTEQRQIEDILAKTDIIDIWGVGRRSAAKLNYLGIFNGLDLARAPLKMIRSNFNVTLEKTVMELNQVSCLELEMPELAKTIISSGSFEYEVQNKEKLMQNLAEFVDCACLRLRQQKAVANGIWVELRCNRFNPLHPQYNNYYLVPLPQPSDNTAHFMTAAREGLERIYREDCWYKKTGVTLVGLEPKDGCQLNWLYNTDSDTKSTKLMQAFDAINKKHGRKTIFFATQAHQAKAYLKREFKSPNFTTSWKDLLKVT